MIDATDAGHQEQFGRDGFIALRQYFDPSEVAEIIANVNRFVREIAPRLPSDQVFFEDKRNADTLKQIQHLDEHDSWFAKLFESRPILETAEELLGGPGVGKNLQYFSKPPGIGRPTPAHQDGYYFMLEPNEAITMWLALDEMDESNGCVRYVRGSQMTGMRDHQRTQTLGFSQGIVDYPTPSDQELEIAVRAQPGDLLVHHALTIHRADGNTTADRQRRALGFVFYGSQAREDPVAHAAYQRRLATELKAAGKI